MEIKVLKLKKGREIALKRKHPWIFSGGLAHINNKPEIGEHVHIADHFDNILATGHYAPLSIAVRILAFEKIEINEQYYRESIQRAFNFRNSVLNFPNKSTNCYRLIAGEGDNLPGLIIDIYGHHAVVQCHTAGMLKDMDLITAALNTVLGKNLETIYLKAIHIKNQDYESRFLKGSSESAIVLENGVEFYVNWADGQKTGFFLDQRDNRKIVGQYSKGKNILNTFCYTGGFSAYAIKNDAKSVTSIDISAVAMEATDKNISLNNSLNINHTSITGNVMEYLKDVEKNQFDIIILDPPAFAKNRNKSHNAVQAYKRLNLAAMNKIKAGGMIFTFSCSQVVDRILFENTIRAAAIECGRDVKFIKHLNQAPDHVINAFHQEGHYLKGLIIVVD